MTARSASARVYDAITIGETLAAFIRGAQPDRYELTAVGAESNVAVGMAQLGCSTCWMSRLGDDELGRFVHAFVAARGVATAVDWDEQHPTAVLIKEIGEHGTRVRYYRRHSAASRLGPADVATLPVARWLHVTGVTAALGTGPRELVSSVVERRTPHTGRVSFDVNYRPALWPDARSAAAALLPLARLADLIFIGDDEAEALVGTADTRAVADALLVRPGQELVLKRGPGAATAVTTGEEVTEPARRVEVVDAVGAGDAFAAGYLTGACRGLKRRERLRLAHALAARVVSVRGDVAADFDHQDLTAVVDASVSETGTKTEAAR